MNFYNCNGQKSKEQVINEIEDCIEACKILDKIDVKVDSFNEQGRTVLEEFENLKNIVLAFADKGKYNNDPINCYEGWNFVETFGKKIETYDDLNHAIFERIAKLKTYFQTKGARIIEIEKPTNKSIDTNTKYTIISFLIAGGIAFLTNLNFAELFSCWKYSVWFHVIFNSSLAFACMVAAWFVFKKFKALK